MKKLKAAKLLFLIVVFVSTQIFIFNSSVSAENITYHSNSGIGFYGEYEFPDDKKSSINNLEKDEGLTIVASEKTEDGGNRLNTKLPQTGVEQSRLSLVGLIVLSCYYLIKRKQKSVKKER